MKPPVKSLSSDSPTPDRVIRRAWRSRGEALSYLSAKLSASLYGRCTGSRATVGQAFTGVTGIQCFHKCLQISMLPVRFRPSPPNSIWINRIKGLVLYCAGWNGLLLTSTANKSHFVQGCFGVSNVQLRWEVAGLWVLTGERGAHENRIDAAALPPLCRAVAACEADQQVTSRDLAKHGRGAGGPGLPGWSKAFLRIRGSETATEFERSLLDCLM